LAGRDPRVVRPHPRGVEGAARPGSRKTRPLPSASPSAREAVKEPRPWVVGAPTLSPTFLARLPQRGTPAEPFGASTVRTYHQARYAIWHALKALGIRSGENVAFPAFHCSTELDAFVHLGIDRRYYGVDDSLRVRIDSLERAIDDRTRAVF